MSFHNYEVSENIICPYCGEEWEPTYEETYIGGEPVECYEEEKQTFCCDYCNKKFTVYPHLTWEYETETIEGEMTQEEAEEKNFA